jgi:glycerophosphoryl diester phosphodiesterase
MTETDGRRQRLMTDDRRPTTASFFSSAHPLVFAHRGGGGIAPENTIAAFDNAIALGVDGIELDVRLSLDGEVVVHHDETLERTTNLAGPVARSRADELGRGGVPTLAAVLVRYPDTKIIVEMKLNTAAFAAAVVQVVRAAAAVPRVCLGSFGLRVVRAARILEPAIATSAARAEVQWALYRSWCRVPVLRVPYAGYQVPEWAGRTRVVSRRFVADAHRAGLRVQVWTVDTAEDALRLLDVGVDALITDRPDIIVPVCQSFR